MVAFLGSTLGNLEPRSRTALLGQMRGLVDREGRLLLGVDLVKDRQVLEAAYNDREGVTAEFNRNILRIVNRGSGRRFPPRGLPAPRELQRGGQPDRDASGARASAARPRRDLDLTVEIVPGETVWTESSYKFIRRSVQSMLTGAGLALECWRTPLTSRRGARLCRPC